MLSFFKTKKTPITKLFSDGFIDIHNHLIPGIDDGAQSIEDAFTLIEKLYGYGIRTIICTPHIMEGVWENTPETILPQLTKLREHIVEKGLTDLKITAAAEYMLDGNFKTLLKNAPLLTLKDNYLLVEMSYLNAPVNLFETLFDIQIANYQPVLAHPERYNFYHSNFETYQKLKEAGCLFQLNLLALSNYYGKNVQKTALKLLKLGMYDFVGTDIHHHRHLNHLATINNPKIIKLVTPILKNNRLFS